MFQRSDFSPLTYEGNGPLLQRNIWVCRKTDFVVQVSIDTPLMSPSAWSNMDVSVCEHVSVYTNYRKISRKNKSHKHERGPERRIMSFQTQKTTFLSLTIFLLSSFTPTTIFPSRLPPNHWMAHVVKLLYYVSMLSHANSFFQTSMTDVQNGFSFGDLDVWDLALTHCFPPQSGDLCSRTQQGSNGGEGLWMSNH